jgi:putative PIN family toxin of toxin-antitoxin system
MPSLTIFLDASVVLAGLASPNGGSGYLFHAARQQKLTLFATPLVIGEVYRHLTKLNLTPDDLAALLDNQVILLVPNPPESLISQCSAYTVDPDDAHVLAGAIASKVNYLLSLDQKHILTDKVKQNLAPIQVLSPKSFWQSQSLSLSNS